MKIVLLVDDAATSLASLSTVLGAAGFEVRTATRAREALDQVRSGLRPNLIISDLTMPQMDGIAFVREVRKLASTCFVPVLLLTTESEQARRQEAKAAGATGWLVKPVPPDQLLGVIKQVVPGT